MSNTVTLSKKFSSIGAVFYIVHVKNETSNYRKEFKSLSAAQKFAAKMSV